MTHAKKEPTSTITSVEDLPLSVSELHRRISSALERNVGEVWVAGEITSINQRGPHTYLEIAEKRGPQKQLVGALSCAILAPAMRTVTYQLKSHSITLEVGTPVKLHGKVELFAQRGTLSFKVDSIDAQWTLGRMVADKDAVLKKLQSQGLLEKQKKEHSLSMVPLKVGLVTADGSAAYADFMDELTKSGIGFEVVLSDTVVQGVEAPRMIQQALVKLARKDWHPDVVVVIRGGGSKNDLAAFDTETVARTIAMAPWPIVVGVGHEVDRSVSDEVAYHSFKTPTAAAQGLISRVRNTHEKLEALVKDRSWKLAKAISVETQKAERSQMLLERSVQSALERKTHQLQSWQAALEAGAGRQISKDETWIAQADKDLSRALERALTKEEGILETAEALIKANDVARVLERGFSITRHKGALVTEEGQVKPGDEIETRTHRGTFKSEVK